MRTRLLSTLTALALAGSVAAAPAASADKPAEPEETGVVHRVVASGGGTVGPVPTDVGGETLPLLVAVGWADTETFCARGAPVQNGVEQLVLRPPDSASAVVHNHDIPVLVFDVSGAQDQEDFFAQCQAGEITALATGTADQRPIFRATPETVFNKVKTRGTVTDVTGQTWTLQSFLRRQLDPGTGEITVLSEWITLTAR